MNILKILTLEFQGLFISATYGRLDFFLIKYIKIEPKIGFN
jgi:hypothetical protein